MTPTNVPVIYTDRVLYHSYMFWHYLHHPHEALHQDLKPNY